MSCWPCPFSILLLAQNSGVLPFSSSSSKWGFRWPVVPVVEAVVWSTTRLSVTGLSMRSWASCLFNTEVDDNDLLLCTTTSKYANKRPSSWKKSKSCFQTSSSQGEMSHPAVVDTTALLLIKHNWKPWAEGACLETSQSLP